MATAGHGDKDYQKLRVERAAFRDEDDDANPPAPPKPVVAATPGSTAPAGTMTKNLGRAPSVKGPGCDIVLPFGIAAHRVARPGNSPRHARGEIQDLVGRGPGRPSTW
jgi:hypothetical protein